MVVDRGYCCGGKALQSCSIGTAKTPEFLPRGNGLALWSYWDAVRSPTINTGCSRAGETVRAVAVVWTAPVPVIRIAIPIPAPPAPVESIRAKAGVPVAIRHPAWARVIGSVYVGRLGQVRRRYIANARRRTGWWNNRRHRRRRNARRRTGGGHNRRRCPRRRDHRWRYPWRRHTRRRDASGRRHCWRHTRRRGIGRGRNRRGRAGWRCTPFSDLGLRRMAVQDRRCSEQKPQLEKASRVHVCQFLVCRRYFTRFYS